MQQYATPRLPTSSPTLENIETWVRTQIQQAVQAMLAGSRGG